MTAFVDELLNALTRYSDKVAIVDNNGARNTTFAQLNAESMRVAAYMHSKGIPENSCITISLPKSMEYFAAEIGCWMAGLTVVPMGDTFPQQRKDYITGHCLAAMTIDSALMDEIGSMEPCKAPTAADENTVAAIFYTSGSTGTPKGVVHTYSSLGAAIVRNRKLMEMTDSDVFSTGAPMYFMASIFDFMALCTGATIHIYPEKVRTDIKLMGEYIKEHGVTTCFMSPSVVAQYSNPSPLLRMVLAASERLSGVAPSGFRLCNAYGQTETAGIVTIFEVDRKYDNTPIGRVADDIDYRIVDEDGREVPKGEEGELCLKGNLTSGYFCDEQRTADLLQDGWLHTGDLVKEQPDGNLLYVNRKDWMVKISGQRVEPGEVEAVMKHCPGVQNAIVKGFENRQGKTYLCGFYIADGDVEEKHVVDFMRQYLPEYMIPTCMARMESFPLNQNGKLDRKSLQSPLETSQAEGELTATEKKLKGTVAELLGTEDFTVNDNLGYIGLTSISSVKLAAAVYKEYGVQLDVRALVKNATVATVAAEIDASDSKDTTDADQEVLTSACLTASQQGVYVDCVSNPENVLYNIPFATRMPAGVTPERLDAALHAFVAAHPFVNCRFVSDESGEARQEARENADFEIPVKELSGDAWAAEKQSFVRPFNLAEGPLYRFEIVKTDSGLYLLSDIHHLIADGGSMDIFFRDLANALDGKALEPERYDYYHFAKDQLIDEETEAFFEQQLSQIEEASQLIPDVYEPKGGHCQKSIYVPTDLGGVEKFARTLNVTPASVFLGAMALTVSKFVAEDTVGLCTISNGRGNSRIAGDMGMFVNTLPLVITTDDEMTVAQYLNAVAENFTATIAHETYPFARVSEKYGFANNIMFGYQVDIFNRYTVGGEDLELESLELDIAKCPVVLMVEGRSGGDAHLHIDYDTDLFTEDMMQGFAASFNRIAGELLCKQQLKDIEVCDDAQIATLDSFNRHQVEPSGQEETVTDAFRKVAAQYPKLCAAVFTDKKYTYEELDDITDRIASLIYGKVKDCGNAEPVVSILIPRNEYMFILPLAALKAGCAYQPLDSSYPPERLNFMVKDASAALLIADPELRGIIDEYDGEVVLTDELDNAAALEKTEIPVTVNPGNLALLLYTSGSTGVPKGVMLEHRNIMAYIRWYHRYYDLNPEHNVSAYASFGFDAFMQDLYAPLTAGATVHVIPEEIRLDLVALNRYLEDNGITHAFMTTQVAVQYLENYPESGCIKHLSLGGEKLRPVNPEVLSYSLHNLYGPSETTCGCTFYQVTKKETNIPIGWPTDTVLLFIKDKYGHRLPVGAAGELVIAGTQVGRGYLNRPDKTAEAFFSIDGRRAYHSGDIVRYRTDGNIEFVGRKDGQVKIRGFRIELKEVEAVIRDFQGIKDVTVQAYDDPNGGKYIAAFVVGDGEVDVNALNAFILDQKPPYMVPAVTMQLERIPLNVNQKVDRKALPKPEVKSGASAEQAAVNAPLNALEEQLKSIIASVVNTDSFSITDVLGYVGLTSISSIKLATLIYKKFGVQVNAKSLAKTGTLQSIENEILSKWMESSAPGQQKAAEQAAVDVPSAQASSAPVPLSYPQMGVYSDCVANSATTIYNIPSLVKLPQGYTAGQVRSAVEGFLAAHPYLNTTFTSDEDNNIVQKQGNSFQLDMPEKAMTAGEFQAEKHDFVRPFNLEEGPLYRFETVTVDGSDLYLLVDFHHLVADGASVDLFLNQLCTLLDGGSVEAETYNYCQFTADQHIDKETEEFFDGRMALVEEASSLIPDVFEKAENHSSDSVSVAADLKAVADRCQQLNITPAALYLAATLLTVSKYTAEQSVGICTISSGRSNMRISDCMGMFVNTLPLTANIDCSAKVDDFLAEVSKTFTDTLAHEDYPFAKIAQKYGFAANILYGYQVGVLNSYSTAKGHLEVSSLELNRAKFPVAIFVDGSLENGAVVRVEYDTDMFTRDMMQGLAESVNQIAAGMLSCSVLSDIEICTPERIALLDSFNHPVSLTEEEQNATVLSAFRKAAGLYPDHEAVVFKDKRMTYRELDQLTDSMGAFLHAKVKDCGREEPVISIIIHRNEWMVLASLAALKAGCAYQPLDPSYPQERLNFMVKDSDAVLLVADPDLREVVNEYQGEVVLTDELKNCGAVTGPLGTLTPHSLLTLLYTSGSTGVPKGVMLEHQNLVAFGKSLSRAMEIGPDSRVAAYASFGFDANMQDIYVTLMQGAAIHIIPEEMRMDLASLHNYFEKEGITNCFMTTQVGVQYLENYPQSASLRHLCMGGEKLRSVKPEELSYKIHNGYGPSETTCGCTFFPVEHWEPNVPIGTPTDTTSLYVVDKQGHRLPAGAPGELWISGPQVGRGYLKRPDKTAESFTSNPFAAGRVYHSGDIVRYRNNGDLEFVGRKDGQVKIRGFRIELKEVEAVIRNFEGIKDVTVQAYDYDDGGKYIAAFVVSDGQVDVEALNAFIKSQKPPYMVPAVTMQIDRIPLNVNQKVDKKALPKPEAVKASYVAPANDVEKTFCEIFEKVLGVGKIGATDDFFENGGSSIVALKLVVAANKAGYDIVYNDVFEHTTPQMLAEMVSGSKAGETPAPEEKNDAETTEEERSYIGPDGFDYRPLNSLLKQNTLDVFRNGKRQELGDVLLTGATGYLGIHILHDLMENYDCKVWCFVRPKGNVSGEKRLKSQLFYYFDKNFDSLFGQRIFVLEGDAMNMADLDAIDCHVDTVINCAALVKHFAKGDEIEKVNVGSVRNIVMWCVKHGTRLVHISTCSIAGTSTNGFPAADIVLNENMFFFGQTLDNQYAHSKFMAERLILDAMLHHGLNAKIMRVGNLSARNVDGEFQINFRSNNFMNMLHAFQFAGAIPYSMENMPVEFSPIDDVAHSILLLSQGPEECIVSHPFNIHKVLLGDVIRELSKYGHNISMVEDEEFGAILQKLMEVPENIEKLRSLMVYNTKSDQVSATMGYDGSYTSQLLYRMDFAWSVTTWDYVQRFIKAVGGLGMFETE